MKKLFVFMAILSCFVQAEAQIGGLSASKLTSYSATVVDHRKIEFEPGFIHSRSVKYWDKNGNLKSIYSTADSVKMVTGMWFRFTYGVTKNLEIGASFSGDLAGLQTGLRYIFLKNDKIGLAAIAGVNIPFGNCALDQRLRSTSNLTQVGLGVVTSYHFNTEFSVDFTGQYVSFTKESIDHDRGGFYLNADIGHYILKHSILLIAGAGYHAIYNDFGSHQIFTVYPGISIETGKNYSVVIALPFDVYGKAETKNTAFSLALTLTFE